MIQLTRLNKEPFFVNITAVQYLERTPETLVVFNNGDRILILESVDEVLARVKAYQVWMSQP